MGMKVTDALELIEQARAERILGGGVGLKEFTILEQTIRSARPEWLPQRGASWALAAEAHPDLVEQITELAIEDGIEPAAFAAASIRDVGNTAPVDERELERTLVACELAAWSATA